MATKEEIEEMVGADEPVGTEETTDKTGEDNAAPPAESVDADDGKEDEHPPDPGVTTEQLNARIAELEKINNGLLQAKTASSAKARAAQEQLQETQRQIDLLKTRLDGDAQKKDKAPEASAQRQMDRLTVDFDENGVPFIPAEGLPVNKDLEQKVAALEQELSQTAQSIRASQEQREEAENLRALLAEKDGYQEAFAQIKDQWDYLSGGFFDQFVVANELPEPRTRDDALEIAANEKFQAAFRAKFPNGDAESVIEAFTSKKPYYKRRALNMALKAQTPQPTHTPLPKDKPQSLSTISGANHAGDDDDLQKFADMSVEDFLSLSPEQERRMNRLMKEKGM